MITRYLEIKKQIKDLEAEAETIKKTWLASLPVGETEMDGHVITISKRTRIDLDKEAVLIAVGPEAYKSLEKISEFTVLTVK